MSEDEYGKLPGATSVGSVESTPVTAAGSAAPGVSGVYSTSFLNFPISPAQVTFEASLMQLVPKVEVDKLINQRTALDQENSDLKFRLNQLLSEKSDSMIALSLREREINQRDKVIKQRDIEIAELQEENKNLKRRIQDLEVENVNLKQRIQDLEVQGKETVRNLDKLLAKEEFEKFLIAIQDLNSLYRLENKFPQLTNLRDIRVSSFHYIKDVDQQQVVNYKRNEVISRIETGMTQGCKKLFVKNFGETFLSELEAVLKGSISALSPATSSLTPSQQSEADDWWD